MRRKAFLLSFVLLFTFLAPSAQAMERFPAYTYEGTVVYDVSGIRAGTRVRLYEAEHEKHYIVSTPSGKRVQVPWDAVLPTKKEAVKLPVPSADEIAAYAGAHMHSKTDYILWVDLCRVRTYLLEYGDEGWSLLRTLPCSVGDAAHPTPSGRYEIAYRSVSIGKEDHYLCRYALCFYGGYMFHSVLYSWDGDTVTDGRLSSRISHGCIRLSPEDSEWLYRKIPLGTAVYIR